MWFLEGTESSGKSDMVKIGIMLTHAGKEAREVYKTLHWTEEGDDKKFNKVIEAFRRYCSPRKHILYEWYTFWAIKQEVDESVDAYLTRIKLKLEMCEYATEVRQDLARDKFVFGLTDDRLKERLLLTTAVGQAQRAESSKRHMKEMSTHSKVNALQRYNRPLTATTIYCGNCGRQHKPKQCPAYGHECNLCHKLNHFSRVCRQRQSAPQHKHTQAGSTRSHPLTSQRVDNIEQNETVTNLPVDESQDLFIESLEINDLEKSTAWFTDLNTSGGQMSVKLDTGAEVSVLPYKIYQGLDPKPPLKSTGMTLSAYGGMAIQPSGICTLSCNTLASDDIAAVDFYVTSIDAHPILGLTDCVQLGLIKRIYSIQNSVLTKQLLKERYPTVFTGLGKLGTYHITLCDSHQPVVSPVRKVPHSLKDRLRQTLERNVASGVLKIVDEPTDWVSNLVVVEKKEMVHLDSV